MAQYPNHLGARFVDFSLAFFPRLLRGLELLCRCFGGRFVPLFFEFLDFWNNLCLKRGLPAHIIIKWF